MSPTTPKTRGIGSTPSNNRFAALEESSLVGETGYVAKLNSYNCQILDNSITYGTNGLLLNDAGKIDIFRSMGL
jgi:hypothetical protein